eukprot:UN01092
MIDDIAGYTHVVTQNTVRNLIYLAVTLVVGWGTVWLMFNRAKEDKVVVMNKEEKAKYVKETSEKVGALDHVDQPLHITAAFFVAISIWCYCLYTP